MRSSPAKPCQIKTNVLGRYEPRWHFCWERFLKTEWQPSCTDHRIKKVWEISHPRAAETHSCLQGETGQGQEHELSASFPCPSHEDPPPGCSGESTSLTESDSQSTNDVGKGGAEQVNSCWVHGLPCKPAQPNSYTETHKQEGHAYIQSGPWTLLQFWWLQV